jgi:hypothetical protein
MGLFDHIPDADTPSPPKSALRDYESGISFAHIPEDPPGPPVSETEQRLTADNLRRLLEARGGTSGARSLSDLITGSEPVREGSLTERATDWLVPGIKNTMGGALSLGRGLVTGDGTFGENWRAGVNAEKQFRDQNRDATNNPLGWAADAAGFLGSAGRAGPPVGSAASIGQPVVQATAKGTTSLPKAVQIGATQGAISGAAENSQDVGSAIQGGVTGGLVGGTVGGAAHGATNYVLPSLVERFTKNKAAAAAERQGQRGPDPDTAQAEAKGTFGQLDNAGVGWDQSQGKRLAGKLAQTLKNANYDEGLNEGLRSVVDDLANIGTRKGGFGFGGINGIDALRGRISAGMRSANANDRRVAGHLAGMVDDFIDTQTPAINRTGADIAKLYPKAREAYRTYKLGEATENIEGVAERTTENLGARTSRSAEDRASTAVTQNLNRIQKRGEHDPFNAEQRAAAEQVSRGTPGQNRLESVNELSKHWQGTSAIGLGLGTALGHVLGAPVPVTGPVGAAIGAVGGRTIGGLAKNAANNIARDNMDELVRAIMTGSRDKPASWEMPRDLLASLMATRAGQRGLGQAVPSSIMKEEHPPK